MGHDEILVVISMVILVVVIFMVLYSRRGF